MSNINWDEAPEGATHILISVLGDNHWYKVSGHKYASWFGGRGNWMLSGWMCSDVMKEVSCKGLSFKAKPLSIKPVYTQAMSGDGELPEVGMECCYSSLAGIVWNKCKIIAYHDGFVWTSDNGIRQIANTKFKPIDQRTDKEKAIDELLKESVIFCNRDTMKNCFSIAYDKWWANNEN